jgi:hypothetical protein
MNKSIHSHFQKKNDRAAPCEGSAPAAKDVRILFDLTPVKETM